MPSTGRFRFHSNVETGKRNHLGLGKEIAEAHSQLSVLDPLGDPQGCETHGGKGRCTNLRH